MMLSLLMSPKTPTGWLAMLCEYGDDDADDDALGTRQLEKCPSPPI